MADIDLDAIRVVLVEPIHSGNIGATARALKNMGISDFTLVNPRSFPDPESLWQAASASDLLLRARVVESLPEAISDCHLILGTSTRSRRLPWPLVQSYDLGPWLELELAGALKGSRIALVFGREVSGLTNDELQLCHAHVQIPAAAEYSSLNLAMAVQILTYELRVSALRKARPPLTELPELAISPHWDAPPASHSEVERLLMELDAAMIESGFYDPALPKQLPSRVRRLFQRLRLDHLEVGLLIGWLKEVRGRLRT